MTTIALIGAGGKMGSRLTANLAHTDFTMLYVEPAPSGQARLAELGLSTTSLTDAIPQADVVILAVPDNLIGQVAHEAVPTMKVGATLIVLDAAAPFAGQLPERADISYVACHPCHPSVFNRDETTSEAQRDFFGGVAGKQSVVIALIQGSDADYARAEKVVTTFFAPVVTAYRVSLNDMVLLEPVLSETVAATCVVIIEEALQEAIRRGIPADAARAFLLGHLGIELAVVFKEVDSPFSDGALKAIEAAKKSIFREDWKKVFEPEAVQASVADIVK
jgi:pyrroline-5-carboxylate reductase